MRRFALLIATALLVAAFGAAQASAGELTLSQASGVTFPNRAYILSSSSKGALSPSQIKVTEDGIPVQGLSIQPASKIGQSHFGTVLLIDTSQSMAGAAEQNAIQAMKAFVAARNPQQPVGIVFFDQTPRVVVPMTTDNAKLDAALATTPALHSGTHIYDAVATALQLIAGAHLTGGSIVLASDGRDTGSTIAQGTVASKGIAQGVRLYTVGVNDSSFDGTTLNSLAEATGGTYTPADSSSLVSLYHQLGVALSNEYLIVYKSRQPLGSKVAVVARVTGQGSVIASYASPTVAPALPSGPASVAHPTSFFHSTAAVLLVCLMCAVLLGLAIMSLTTRRVGVQERVGPFVGLNPTPMVEDRPRTLVQRALGDPRSRRVEKSHWIAVLDEEIDVARIPITPGRLIVLTILATFVLGYALLTLEGALAAALALLVPFGVRMGVRMKANRQRSAFSEQLPDNLAVVASALRAGNTFVGSLGVVTADAPEPSKRELRRALSDEQLGVPLVDALNKISDRMQSTDFHHVALVATLQAETGGNTAEVLDVVTDTIRERLELRRLVKTLTAQGRLAGTMLSGLPVALLLGVSLINPHYTSPLFHQTVGIIALAVAGIMVVVGSLVIRRIVNIDV